jgi:cytochrome d ubiquinol oxidase subunit II
MPDLQTSWFLLVGVLLAGYAILDGLDLGAGMVHLFVAEDDDERRLVIGSVGPIWDGNEVWLLTGGGALFAAFPPVYATTFSGFYLAIVLLLVGLILRAVSVEFRSKEASPRWRRSWDVAFAGGSFLPALLLGVAAGNVLRGLPLDVDGEFAGTFLSLLNPFALIVGLLSVALFVAHGGAWVAYKTEGALRERSRRAAGRGFVAAAVLWIAATAWAAAALPHLWGAYRSPGPWAVPLILLAALVAFPVFLRRDEPGRACLATSVALAMCLALMGQGLFPNLVPALGDLTRSLTIYNASSSPRTLGTMLVIALLGMPLVIAYTSWIYWTMRGPVRLEETVY